MAQPERQIWESYEIYAQDPGDLVIVIQAAGANQEDLSFPVKSISVDKTIEVTAEYGTGSHLPYQLTPGKIGFSGTFNVGTWISKSDKEALVKALTLQDDEGLPRYFRLEVHDRPRPVQELPGVGEADLLTMQDAATPIEVYDGCMLTGDGIDIGEPGATTIRKYPFVCMRRIPA